MSMTKKYKFAGMFLIFSLFLIGGISSLEINSPMNNQVYESRMVLLNLNFTEGNLKYARHSNDLKYTTLCRDCDEYGMSRLRRKPFKEGFNKISFLVESSEGNFVNDVEFYVDSKKPRIYKIIPKNNEVTNGNFLIKYSEVNLQNISLMYGVDGDYRIFTKYDCESGERKTCEFNVDLEEFGGMGIDYWFAVNDFLRVVESKKMKIFVNGILEEPETPTEDNETEIPPENPPVEPPEDNETEIPPEIVEDNHDVALIDFINSIDGIRIEYINGSDILDNLLYCNQDYKIGVTLKNQGDFIEDVYFNGSVGELTFNHIPKLGLEVGGSSLKTKTINLSLSSGTYNIEVVALIDNDVNVSNNIVKRAIEIVC